MILQNSGFNFDFLLEIGIIWASDKMIIFDFID